MGWLTNSFAYNLFKPITKPKTSKTTIKSDLINFYRNNYLFIGNVSVNAPSYLLLSQNFNLSEPLSIATGTIKFQNNAIQITANRIQLNSTTKQVTAINNKFSLTKKQLNGNSKIINLTSNIQSNFTNVKISTCPIQQNMDYQDWHIKASNIDIDSVKGWATARDVTFRVKGIPIFYLPFFNFAVDPRRKSGVLGLNVASSNIDGKNLSLPYYWNIRHDTDLLGEVNIIESRGLWHSAKVRHLSPNSFTNIYAETIDKDKIKTKPRNFFAWQQTGTITPQINYQIDLNKASDISYFKDFNSKAFSSDIQYINKLTNIQYATTRLQTSLKVHQFQSLNDNKAKYQLMPQINLNWQAESYLNLGFSYTDFKHRDSSKIVGDRQYFNLSLQKSFGKPYLTATPAIFLTTTQYHNLKNSQHNSYSHNAQTFALDNKLFLERGLSGKWQQTLTPRIYYAKRNKTSETSRPSFDSSAVALSYQSLFGYKTFTGYDKSGELDRVSLGIKSQFINQGKAVLTLSLAQAHDLANQSKTDFVSDANFNYNKWLINSTLQIDKSSHQTNKNISSISYILNPKNFIKIQYTENKKDNSQQLLWGARSKLDSKWQVFATTNSNNVTTQRMQVGFSYGLCCWQVLFAISDETKKPSNPTTNNIEYDRKFHLLFDLKGLSNSLIDNYIKSIFK